MIELLSLDPKTPFGDLVVGHSVQIDFGVRREPPGSAEFPFDLSDDRFEVWIRARDADGEVVEGRAKKLAKFDGGDGGYVSDRYSCGADAYDTLHWSLVRVDTEIDDDATESGSDELLLFSWLQAILVTTP